jgi:predicted RNA-binding protein with PUA-like domain
MAYWLVKSEPGCWSFADHLAKGVEPWTGVRNHQAAAHLRAMRVGDRAFFYHSVEEKRIVGILEVVGEASPDPTDPAGRFVSVDFKAVEAVPRPVTLTDIKAEPRLAHLALLKQSRLSVVPIDADAWGVLCAMAGLDPARHRA